MVSAGSTAQTRSAGSPSPTKIELPPPTDPIWFTTKAVWVPTSGGLGDADQFCQTEAAAAGLTGTFRALLSTTMAPASSRFAPNASYVRPDGARIGTLAQVEPDTFPVITADGTIVTGIREVWTGGRPSAASTSPLTSCADWTGAGSGTAGEWRHSTSRVYETVQMQSCTTGSHLYCLQE